jgi:hypothetical protein
MEADIYLDRLAFEGNVGSDGRRRRSDQTTDECRRQWTKQISCLHRIILPVLRRMTH